MNDLILFFVWCVLLFFYSLVFTSIFTGRKPDELDANWKNGFIVILLGSLFITGSKYIKVGC